MATTVEDLTKYNGDLRSLIQDASKNEAQILEKLDELNVKIVTADILRESGINKVLNELKKHENTTIASRSRNVIETYKTQLRSAGAMVSPSTPAPKRKAEEEVSAQTVKKTASGDVPSATPSTTATTATTTTTKSTTTSTDAAAAPTTPNKPKPSGAYSLGGTGDNIRDKAQQMIYDGLGPDDNDATEYRTEIAVKCEATLFQHYNANALTSPPNSEYKSRLRIIVSNLKDPKNTELNQRIYYGEISPEELATMSEHDMASNELRQVREAEQKESLEARKTDLNVGSVGTDMFQCPKCKERKTSFYQRQTRSSDEPMTIFLTCLVCRHRWRQY